MCQIMSLFCSNTCTRTFVTWSANVFSQAASSLRRPLLPALLAPSWNTPLGFRPGISPDSLSWEWASPEVGPQAPHPCPAHNGWVMLSSAVVVRSSVSLMGPALITMCQSLSPILLPALYSCASPLPVASFLLILQPSNKLCLNQSPGLLPSVWSPPSSPCVVLHRCLLSQGRGLSWSLRPGTGTCVHSLQKLDVVSGAFPEAWGQVLGHVFILCRSLMWFLPFSLPSSSGARSVPRVWDFGHPGSPNEKDENWRQIPAAC